MTVTSNAPSTTNTVASGAGINHTANPATVLIRIPSRPPIRSATSTSSTGSSKSVNLADKTVEQVVFRHGRVDDAALMTEMQVSNYWHHYPGICPQVFLDTLDHPKMTAGHVSRMTPSVDEREMAYVVAERTNAKTGELEIIGMSQAMVPDWERAYNHRFYEGWSQDDFDCEVDTLYVKVGVQGGGIGRKLVLGALEEAYERFNMRRSVIIWTLFGNTQARNFYSRIGCTEVALRTLDLAGVPAECVGFGFRSIGEAIGK